MQRSWDRWMSLALLVMFGVFCLMALPTCATGMTSEAQEEATDTVTPLCPLDSVQHPFREATALPGGRGFLANGNHLGWDLMAPEGLPVYPLGCGVVRAARPASGYGTLAVVIEHRLREPMPVLNGRGARVVVHSILSIYGHIRPTSGSNGHGVSTGLRVGDVVTPERVIGYIEHRSRNGDGDEHLHFGIRLQGATASMQSDPAAWFRGYDTTPSQRGWFTDPRAFLQEMSVALEDGASSSVPLMDAGTQAVDRGAVHDSPMRVLMDSPPLSMDASVSVDHGERDAGRSLESDIVIPHIPQSDAFAAADVSNRSEDVPSILPRIRYEFRIRSSLRVAPPYYLRDHWWRMMVCDNTRTTATEVVDGWARCDAERLELFDGSFYVPDHPDWGDRGQIGTVANSPTRCTPVDGAEWRLTDLTSQRVLFQGAVSDLMCRSVGTQDRLVFPR